MNTTDKRITTFDAVDKALRQQEFERAIHNRWCNTFAASRSIQFGQDIVGTQRLVANQQNFENLPTSRGQAQFAQLANAPRRGQQLALTTAMIVFAKCDVGRLNITRHNVIL